LTNDPVIDARDPGFDARFTMAFQPIVDLSTREVFAYEALVRGTSGESASQILGRIEGPDRFAFHEAFRVRAIEMAADLGVKTRLSLNVTPNDLVGRAQCFRTAIDAANRCGFPVQQLMFEITEGEKINDLPGLATAFQEYKSYGFTSAIDDFGAAYAGFELLSAFQPDVVKIDMSLIRDIHIRPVQFTILKGFVTTCDELGIRVVAEGVESDEEVQALRDLGVTLFQGFLFARPGVGFLPDVHWPA
jgi:EAL domain-containing protein (putative c-di-GMP-specific phosphodiesterase class I)